MEGCGQGTAGREGRSEGWLISLLEVFLFFFNWALLKGFLLFYFFWGGLTKRLFEVYLIFGGLLKQILDKVQRG